MRGRFFIFAFDNYDGGSGGMDDLVFHSDGLEECEKHLNTLDTWTYGTGHPKAGESFSHLRYRNHAILVWDRIEDVEIFNSVIRDSEVEVKL